MKLRTSMARNYTPDSFRVDPRSRPVAQSLSGKYRLNSHSGVGVPVIDAQGVRAAPTAASYIVWTFLVLGGALGSFFAIWRGRAFFVSVAGQWRPGLVAGALSIITYGFALLAFRLGATPRLAALRETSILFGTAIAVIFLKERLSRLRTAGVIAIAGGAIALIAVQ
jgi:drug/metabolite transporter (DMT)-like permease